MKWTIILWKYKKGANEFPLALRVQGFKSPKYSWLNLPGVQLKDWDAKAQEVKPTDKRSAFLNSEIAKAKKKIFDILADASREDIDLSADGLIQRFEAGSQSKSFIHFVDEHVKGIENVSTQENHEKVLRKFKLFLAGKEPKFSEINIQLIEKFKKYLATKGGRGDKGLKPQTIKNHLKTLKAWINEGIRLDYLAPGKNPFDKMTLTDGGEAKEPLSDKELHKYAELNLSPGSNEWHARNFFLFSYMCQGMRWWDFATLRSENFTREDGTTYLSYKMHKTGVQMVVEVLPEALQILEVYKGTKPFAFPVLSREDYLLMNKKDKESQKAFRDRIDSQGTRWNYWLRKGFAKTEVPKRISFHIGRHSVAESAKEESLQMISSLLGHKTTTVTQKIYMSNFKTQETSRVARKRLRVKIA
jgi:integrase/recombinase XerD